MLTFISRRSKRRDQLIMGIFGAVLTVLTLSHIFAQGGQTFSVNMTDDVQDANVDDGRCDVDLGADGDQCTLRAAITEANRSDPHDTINVPAGIYTLTIVPGGSFGDDSNNSDDLDITNPATIVGAGPGMTIIRSDMGGIEVPVPVNPVAVNINNLTISGDSAQISLTFRSKAPNGTITLDNVHLVDNWIGAQIDAGSVTIQNSVISGHLNTRNVNTDLWFGAGVFNKGTLTLINSEISDNTVTGASATLHGRGAGIYNQGVLTLNNVSVLRNTAAQHGGGIYNRGTSTAVKATITIINGLISENLAGTSVAANIYGTGGGIYNDQFGVITMTGTQVLDNVADAAGGIRNTAASQFDIFNSFIMGNQATNAPDPFDPDGVYQKHDLYPLINGGGGVMNDVVNSKMTITRTTISGNSGTMGGGVMNYRGGDLTINDSTISGNTVSTATIRGALGAGIYNGFPGYTASGAGTGTTESKLHLNNVTISGNSGNSAGSITAEGGGIWTKSALWMNNVTIASNFAEKGGGLYQEGGSHIMMARSDSIESYNTLIANNSDTLAAPDCWDSINAINSGGHNLLSRADTCDGYKQGQPGDIYGSVGTPLNALLGPLQNNGGSTSTHAIADNSPARNAGDAATCLNLDQRGHTRAEVCDIGAYEFGGQIPTATYTTGPGTGTPGTGTPGTSTPGTSTPGTKTPVASTPTTPAPTATVNPAGTPTVNPTQIVQGNALVDNGGFETTDRKKPAQLPGPWNANNLTYDTRVCNKTGKPPVTTMGLCAFQFLSSRRENSSIVQKVSFADIETLRSGDIITLSAWVKTEKLKGVAQIKAQFTYVNPKIGNKGKDIIKLKIDKGTKDYTLMAGQVTLKGLVYRAKLVVIFQGSNGKMRIDDLRVQQISSGAPLADVIDGTLPLPDAPDLRGSN